jgi:hypothetical protein
MEYVIEKEKEMLASPTLEQYLARQAKHFSKVFFPMKLEFFIKLEIFFRQRHLSESAETFDIMQGIY